MASDRPDLEGFVAAIDAKISDLQRLRESVIASAPLFATDFDPNNFPTGAVSAAPASPTGSGPANSPVELPTGVFRGKGLADAIRSFMAMAKRKQTFKEIKSALVEGGLATTSAFFDQTLSSTLHRMRKSGELLQFKDGWDLAESYPPSFRQRLEDTKEAGTPKRKRKGAKGKKTERPAKASTAKKGSAQTASDSTEPVLRAV